MKGNVRNGQAIAEKIRLLLANIDLRIVYAGGEYELALADYTKYAKLSGVKNERKALRYKATAECYKAYLGSLNSVKQEINVALDAVLSRYTPKYKRIWTMYFIEQASIQEIATQAEYTTRYIDKIIQKFKLDLECYIDKEVLNDGQENNNQD